MVKYPHPSTFDKELTDDKLTYISKLMFQSFDKTFKDTRDIDDDNYTFGTMFLSEHIIVLFASSMMNNALLI